MKKLTPKQRAAADKLIALGGVPRAKETAYSHAYNVERYKPKTLRDAAYKLFALPHVAAYIQERRQGALAKLNLLDEIRNEHVEINAAWVLKRAALLADFNIRKFLTVDARGQARYDFSAATDDDWYCIEEYTCETVQRGKGEDVYDVERVKIKAASKLAALKLVGQHIDVQAFKEALEHSGTVTTENYDLTDTERSSRITAILNAARDRGAGSTH